MLGLLQMETIRQRLQMMNLDKKVRATIGDSTLMSNKTAKFLIATRSSASSLDVTSHCKKDNAAIIKN